jgi:hypothetical protein
VLEILDALGVFFGAIILPKHFQENLGALVNVFGKRIKHFKEIVLARH